MSAGDSNPSIAFPAANQTPGEAPKRAEMFDFPDGLRRIPGSPQSANRRMPGTDVPSALSLGTAVASQTLGRDCLLRDREAL